MDQHTRDGDRRCERQHRQSCFRAAPTGSHPGALWLEQSLNLPEAIAVYTRSVAEAIGYGDVTGSIEVGKSADVAVLDQNCFEVKRTEIARTKVLQTYVEGRLVHEA